MAIAIDTSLKTLRQKGTVNLALVDLNPDSPDSTHLNKIQRVKPNH